MKTIVVIPTYNEAENLESIVSRVTTADPGVHVLVVDDGSPDGTGAIADHLASHHVELHVMHRQTKEGLGAAYLAGFAWALTEGFDVVVEMDADGSHAPEELPRLLNAIALGADVAIGSRYVTGGKTLDWPRRRRFLSRTANLYARLALRTAIEDITSGFRAYRGEVLSAMKGQDLRSTGYCFQVEMAWHAHRMGFDVVEVPITFADREFGESKMDVGTIVEAIVNITAWGIRGRMSRGRAANVVSRKTMRQGFAGG